MKPRGSADLQRVALPEKGLKCSIEVRLDGLLMGSREEPYGLGDAAKAHSRRLRPLATSDRGSRPSRKVDPRDIDFEALSRLLKNAPKTIGPWEV